MNKQPPPALIDADNPEWTAQDVKDAVPFSGLPATMRAKLGGLSLALSTPTEDAAITAPAMAMRH